MQIFYGLPKKSERRPCALAIGNFDGVHLGHQKLLHKVVELAKQRQLVPAVLTFEPHPKEFFGKSPDKAPARILSLRDKVETICRFGIQRIFILRFNEELASLSPKDFAESILAEGLEAKSIVIGENFHFGYKGEGDVHSLTSYGRSLGFDVTPLPMADLGGIPVSSTRIRLALKRETWMMSPKCLVALTSSPEKSEKENNWDAPSASQPSIKEFCLRVPRLVPPSEAFMP